MVVLGAPEPLALLLYYTAVPISTRISLPGRMAHFLELRMTLPNLGTVCTRQNNS